MAKILGARKITGVIKIHRAQLKKGKFICILVPSVFVRPTASVPLGRELSYLTEQIKIRTSYLCLTALHIPEGDHLSK